MAPRCRLDEFGVCRNVVQKPLSISGELEEVILLAQFLRSALVIGTQALGKLGFCFIRLAPRAIQSLVGSFVNIALRLHLLPELLDKLNVPSLRRADEVVVGNVKALPRLFPNARHLVDIRLNILTR